MLSVDTFPELLELALVIVVVKRVLGDLGSIAVRNHRIQDGRIIDAPYEQLSCLEHRFLAHVLGQ